MAAEEARRRQNARGAREAADLMRRERAPVQAELAQALAEQAERERAFDAALTALPNPLEAIGAAA